MTFKTFAIVPAAGRGLRMGRQKLLMELDGRPLIDLVLQSWCESSVDRTVVVVRPGDDTLIQRCRRFLVHVVISKSAPRGMRESVQEGLSYACRSYSPADSDAWLVAPADIPGLSSELINRVLSQYDPRSASAVVPEIAGKRGHPVLLPWRFARRLPQLPAELGLNALVRSCEATIVNCSEFPPQDDINTLSDYKRHVAMRTSNLR